MGLLHTDLVQAGGFIIDRQVLGMASVITGFKENGVDGTFGLGLRSLSTHGKDIPMKNEVEGCLCGWSPCEQCCLVVGAYLN